MLNEQSLNLCSKHKLFSSISHYMLIFEYYTYLFLMSLDSYYLHFFCLTRDYILQKSNEIKNNY